MAEAVVVDEETIRVKGVRLKPGTRLRVYRGEGLLVLLEGGLPEGRLISLKPGEKRRLARDLVAEKTSDGRLVLYVEDE